MVVLFKKNTSLILSNNARPSPGISIENYEPIKVNIKLLKPLNAYNYIFFINMLESSRHIKNAKFLGFKATFFPTNYLNFSVMRTAQFGGDSRSESLSSFVDLIFGKDNYNYTMDQTDEPGNQLAGFNINYKMNNSTNIYAQIIGEDEANFFPAKNIYHIGATKLLSKDNHTNITLEFFDTESRKNITYNHHIYKDGYRYFGKSIGADIDADSEKFLIALTRLSKKSNKFKLTLQNINLNKNNNTNNSIYANNLEFQQLSLELTKKINSKLSIISKINYRNKDIPDYSNLNLFLRLEYNL